MQSPCACLKEALLIQATADLMRLPQAAVGSALVLLHRFHTAPPKLDIPEQTPTRTNDLLNAVRFAALHLCAAPGPGGQGAAALPDDQAPQQAAPFAPLVGEQYYAAKEQLILDEQALLRTLRFDLIAEQPHRYLLNFCRLLHCSHAVNKLAVCLACPSVNKLYTPFLKVNDSLRHTCLCTRFGAAEVAAGALHLAVLLLGASTELPHSSRLGWWDAVGVPLAIVEAVSQLLCDAVAGSGGGEQQPQAGS